MLWQYSHINNIYRFEASLTQPYLRPVSTVRLAMRPANVSSQTAATCTKWMDDRPGTPGGKIEMVCHGGIMYWGKITLLVVVDTGGRRLQRGIRGIRWEGVETKEKAHRGVKQSAIVANRNGKVSLWLVILLIQKKFLGTIYRCDSLAKRWITYHRIYIMQIGKGSEKLRASRPVHHRHTHLHLPTGIHHLPLHTPNHLAHRKSGA